MSPPTASSLAAGAQAAPAALRRQLRGSTLLLAGRLLSRGVNFASQVLIVRYLAKSDYGAFAWALSLAGIAEAFITFGLDRAVTRFVPIFHEQGNLRKLLGTLAIVITTMATLAVAAVLLVYGLAATAGDSLSADPTARALLLVLVFLAPVQALDTVLVGMFAAFASPRAIFFRKHVLAPGLRLAVVIGLMASGAGVAFLAWGYVVAGALGVALYGTILVRLMRREGLFAGARSGGLELPWGEVFAFTVPLLSSDLVYVAIHAGQGLLLERFRDTLAVASLRAVVPVAMLNQLVFASFTTLFTPQAARLFARGDRAGIHDLYWRTAVWIAVLSFPFFALSFSLADPLTVALFGSEYADAGVLLAVLAGGYYFNAALGFNGLTLKVFGRVGYVMTLNLVTVAASLALSFWLIPRWGALGAAVATSATLVVHNLLKHVGLLLGTGVRLFDRRYAGVYGSIVIVAAGLFAIHVAGWLPFPVELALATLGSLAVVRWNRALLDVEGTLPELLRLPPARWLLGR